MDDAHVRITVGGTTYSLVVDPTTYGKVDIVDFAPRAIAGTPAFSELGLYLDVAQLGFGHGYGEETFGEPLSYAYSGSLVDTRHGFASLWTNPVTDIAAEGGLAINKITCHRDVMVMAHTAGIRVRLTDLSWYEVKATINYRDIVSNGRYMFLSSYQRMLVADLGGVLTGTSTTVKSNQDPEWTTDIFTKSGTVVIYAGTGAGQVKTVSSNTSDTITISGTFSPAPDTSSKFFVYGNAGNDSNTPTNFNKFALFGGYMWASEFRLPYLHYWAELDGSDAEGSQETDTSAIRVGPGDIKIEYLIPFNNQLWAFRRDGGWAVGDDNVAYHMIDVSDQYSASNFQAVAVWNGFLWFNVRNTLYKYRSGLQDVTPPVWDEHFPIKHFGHWQSLIPRGKFLYVVGKSNASNSTDESGESTGFMALLATDGVGWHKLMIETGASSPALCGLALDPKNDYLYAYFKGATATNLYRVPLQEYSDLPYLSFPTTGNHRLYTSYYDLGHKRITKSYASVALEGEFPTNTSVIIKFRVDANTAWTSLGTVTSSLQEIDFPANTTGKRVQLQLDLQTSTSTNTPIIRAVIIKQMMRPDVLYGVSFEAILMDNLGTPEGLALAHDAAELRTALMAARDSKTPITFTDIHGDSASAYISSLRFILVELDEQITSEMAKMTVVYV